MIDSVIDTCERYWNDCKQKGSRKERSLERISQEAEKRRSKHRQPLKDDAIKIESDLTLKASPVRRKYERENTPEIFKRRKTNDVTDSGVVPNIVCKTG